MKKNINQQRTVLSLGEAIEIIDKRPLGILVTPRTEVGDCISFTFNKISVEREILVFGQEYGRDRISFPVSDVTEIVFTNEGCDQVEFSLPNGETWSIILCGSGVRNPRPRELYKEIQLDEVIRRISDCKTVGVGHIQARIKTNTFYDIISIKDTDNDWDWGGDREVTLTLRDTKNELALCEISLDEYDTKYYIDHESFPWTLCSIHIGLMDTAFTNLVLVLEE